MALENYNDCDPLIVDSALTKLKRNEFHKKLRNQLIMLPIPKINGGNHKGSHFLERAVERVSIPMLRVNSEKISISVNYIIYPEKSF